MRYTMPGIKKKLVKVCKSKGMAVKDLEAKMGVCHGFFNRDTGILVEHLMKACEILEVSVKEVTK